MGFLSGMLPTYIQESFSEINSPLILTMFQIAFPFGILVMGVVAYLGCLAPFAIFKFSFCWGLMMTLTMPVALLCFFIRTSPYDFLYRGYNSPALETLIDMYGDPIVANEKMRQLFFLCRRQAELSKLALLHEAFSNQGTTVRIFYAVFCQIANQFSGVNAISIHFFFFFSFFSIAFYC